MVGQSSASHQNGPNPNSSNPYMLFRFCCTNLYTKDHAQICGVVSFSLFLCLIVIFLMLFGALSIFYVVIGVIVYSLLMKSLFGFAEKLYVLFYLLFEAVQIGFYLALTLYIILPLLFLQYSSQHCEPYSTIRNGTVLVRGRVCRQVVAEEYFELLLFILLLVSIKLYFARVFAHFYKFLVWNEKMLLRTAQYINGRGVQFPALGRTFPAPPPTFWDNSVIRESSYGYEWTPRIGTLDFGELPSYSQAVGQLGEKELAIEEMEVVGQDGLVAGAEGAIGHGQGGMGRGGSVQAMNLHV